MENEPKKSAEEIAEELFGQYYEYVDDDIHSLDRVAGSSVVFRRPFLKAIVSVASRLSALEAENSKLREALPEWTVTDLEDEETLPLDFDPVLCMTDDGLQILQLCKYQGCWEWDTCFNERNRSFSIDYVKKWAYIKEPEQ